MNRMQPIGDQSKKDGTNPNMLLFHSKVELSNGRRVNKMILTKIESGLHVKTKNGKNNLGEERFTNIRLDASQIKILKKWLDDNMKDV